MRDSARLDGRESGVLEDSDNLVDELFLPRRKLGLWLFLQPRVDACFDDRAREGPELIHKSTKLAAPQEQRVVLDVVKGHGPSTQYPVSPSEKPNRRLAGRGRCVPSSIVSAKSARPSAAALSSSAAVGSSTRLASPRTNSARTVCRQQHPGDHMFDGEGGALVQATKALFGRAEPQRPFPSPRARNEVAGPA